MPQFLQDRLWDLLVNFLGFLLSGGVLLLIIELRRHRREQVQWQREEAKLEIDVPRAEIIYGVWEISDKMTDKEQLKIYKHQLEGKVRDYIILVDFVIRNTTEGELMVTSYGVEENAPPGDKLYRLYDLRTNDYIPTENLSPIVLKPLGIIARTVLIDRNVDIPLKMGSPPTHVQVYADTSEGIRRQKKVALQEAAYIPFAYTAEGELHLEAYVTKLREKEERLAREYDATLEASAAPPPSEIGEDEIPF